MTHTARRHIAGTALAATALLAGLLVSATTALHAETSDVSSAGFKVTTAVAVESDPQEVWPPSTP